jgi:hypothetical protein
VAVLVIGTLAALLIGLSTRPPAGPAPPIAVPHFAPTMASMPTQAATISAIVETRELAGDTRSPGLHDDVLASGAVTPSAHPPQGSR